MANWTTTNTKIMGVVGRDFLRIPRVQAGVQKAFHSIFDHYGIDAQYHLFRILPDQLPLFIESAKLLQMPGFGVTMPYKRQIIPYIDHLSDTAKLYEAVNLVIIKNGHTYGYMTDGIGFCGIWDERGYQFFGKRVTMIGAGAISMSICFELAKRGVTHFTIINRSVENAEHLVLRLREKMQVSAYSRPFEQKSLDEASTDTDVLIQTTSLGMTRNNTHFPYLGFIDKLPEDAIVCDVITSPLTSDFLQCAKRLGHTCSDGADMLSYQLLPTMKYYFENEFPFDDKVTKLAQQAFRNE